MKYDDTSWHYGGNFPEDLPDSAGGTHIGMFVCWAMLNGLAGSIHTHDFPEMLAKLKSREMTPGAWFISACDEKFSDEDLSDDGNAFAAFYYTDKKNGTKPSKYLIDYVATFSELTDLYSVPDTWQSFDRLKPTIDQRFADWKSPAPPADPDANPKGWRRFFQ